MSLIENLKKYDNNLKKYINGEVEDHIDYLKAKDKKFVPEHEWWKLEDIDSACYQNKVSDGQKYFYLNDYLNKLLENNQIDQMKKILILVEVYLVNCSEKERKTIEVFLIEGLVNRALDMNAYDLLYSLLGPLSKKLCDENNKFWIKVGEITRKELEEHNAIYTRSS